MNMTTDPRVPLLAAALPEHNGCTPEAHGSCVAYAQAIIAALPEGAWPDPELFGALARQEHDTAMKNAALRAALEIANSQRRFSPEGRAEIDKALADTAAVAEQFHCVGCDGHDVDNPSRALLDGGEK